MDYCLTANGANVGRPYRDRGDGVDVPIYPNHGLDPGDCVRRYCGNGNLDSVRDYPNAHRARHGS
jgi:hypothetical protein